jgi:hypothetical protein
VALLGLLLLVAIALLGAVELGVPIGGLSRSDAVALATTMVRPMELPSFNQPSVAWATPGLLAFFVDRPLGSVSQWQELVWAFRLQGTFNPASCGPATPPGQSDHCPPGDHTATVVLDYRRGIPIFIEIEP